MGDTPRMEMDDDELARFTAFYVELPNGCWQWIGDKDRDGYGRFWWRKGTRRAHRVAYEHWKTKLQHTVDHLCRNRACVNPDHLDDKTIRDNVLCGTGHAVVNAAKTHCPRGHEYTEENTYRFRGERFCIECRRDKSREYQRKKRADAKARKMDESKVG